MTRTPYGRTGHRPFPDIPEAAPKVAFKAVRNSKRYGQNAYPNFAVDTSIQFNTVEYNFGNGYDDTNDCHFKAPVKGVYSFKFRGLMFLGMGTYSKVHFKLRKATTESGLASNGAGGSWAMNQENNALDFDGSPTGTGEKFVTLFFLTEIELEKDEYVRPYFRAYSNMYFEQNNIYGLAFNEFSGHLLFAT